MQRSKSVDNLEGKQRAAAAEVGEAVFAAGNVFML
jgi:hypothetical protein